jgi:hypothetical protein
MERQTQGHSGKKQQFDSKFSPSRPSLRNQASLEAEEEKQQDKEAHASIDAQSKAISGEDQTRVAELAYALYEQRGRKDGHDLEDWFNAEQRIMTQGGSSRSLDEVW